MYSPFDEKIIIIPNKGLVNNYNIGNEEFLYGLFKNPMEFESLMKSDGGSSNLILLERSTLTKEQHYGKGTFSKGLYA